MPVSEKEDMHSLRKEISNNILVLILIVIIFVSVIGSAIVAQTIKEMKEARKMSGSMIQGGSESIAGSGIVGLTILPKKEDSKKAGGN